MFHLGIAKLMAAATGALLISIWAKELLSLLLDAIFAPLFGLRLSSVSFFGIGFDYSYEQGWHRIPYRRSELITHNVTADIRKPVPAHDYQNVLLFLRAFLMIGVGVLLIFLTRHSYQALGRGEDSIPDCFLIGFSGGFTFHSLFSLGSAIYITFIMMKRLAGYVQSLATRVRKGEAISDMNLRPIDELPYPKASKMERMMYYNFYLFYLLRKGDIDGMREPIREMTQYYQHQEFIAANTMQYCWLVFYYSRYDLNPQAASIFYERVAPSLVKDDASNAKRVLAYYAYGVERDLNKAQQLVNEGLANIDHFGLAGEERECERGLLLELQGYINTARSAS